MNIYEPLVVGDRVTRNMAGAEIEFKITEIDDKFIHCGPWKFCKKTGAEVDEDLNWGPPPQATGSFILLHSNNYKYN